MSLNNVDYTKKLSKQREYLQEQSNKVKQNAEKRVDDIDRQARQKIQKQHQTHIEDRADLEKSYQKSIEKIKEKSMESEANSTGRIQQDRDRERKEFTAEITKKRKDFQERLDDIRSSYKKAFDAEEYRHDQLEDSKKKKYDDNISEIRTNLDTKIDDYQEKMRGAGADLKDQYSRERQQLVRAQEERLRDAFTDAAEKRAELKYRIDQELKITRDSKEAELDQLRRYNDDRVSSLEKKFQAKNDSIINNYTERNNKLVEGQKLTTDKTNKEHRNEVNKLVRGFADALRRNELEKRRRDNGSGEFAEFISKQQGLNSDVVHEKKIKRLGEELVSSKREHQAKLERERDLMNEALREQSVDAVTREEKKIYQANANQLVTFARERERAEKQIDNRENQNVLERTAYETQIMHERNNASQRLTKLKEAFNKSLISLDEKHKAALEDVTTITNKDKGEFSKKLEERRREENYEMKRAFSKLMDATVQDYEKRLATFQRENEYLKLTMDQKVTNILDQTQKQLDSQYKLFEDRKTADIKAQQLLMDQRESQLKRNLSEMNLNYQKKIDRLMVENDTKFKLMTNDYENKLKEQKALASKELTEKSIAHQIELDRVKAAYESEKGRLVDAYEVQIDAIKKGHEDQMRQMADFKRLS